MALPPSTLAEVADRGRGNFSRADKPDQSMRDGRALPALDVFK
jgi:hypothetical protein